MKVNLTSTPEFSLNVLKEVVLILTQTPGEMEFILGKPLTLNQYSLVLPKLKTIDNDRNLSF